MELIKEYFKNNWKHILIIVAILLVFLLVFYFIYEKQQKTEEKLQKAMELTQEQATNVNDLQNKLAISKQNAEVLVDGIIKAQNNKVQPATSIVVQAPTVERAVESVVERINEKDTSLPPEALEATDRTVVVSQPDNTDYQVGVYKINTYKNWNVGSGIGYYKNDIYIPVALQRNYAKDKLIEVQINVDPSEAKIEGGQILHKKAVNKLFGIF